MPSDDHDPHRSYQHAGGLDCPACGAGVEEAVFEANADVEWLNGTTANDDELVRVHLEPCGVCDTPLDLAYASALPDAIGVDLFLEVPAEAREEARDDE